ncbi:MAG: hypothetical protein JNL98_12240 [Bryobacterales bacterium]|nr:hypothetical protein [Bryobacterales bacterium]
MQIPVDPGRQLRHSIYMRLFWLACVSSALWGQECEFAGTWILHTGGSEIRQLPFAEEASIKVTCNKSVLTIESAHGSRTYAIDGTSSLQSIGGLRLSSRTKWEGSALLINSLSTAGRQFTLADRWRLSRGGALTIRRQYSYGASDLESTLVYQREGAGPQPAPAPDEPSQAIPVAIGQGSRSRTIVYSSTPPPAAQRAPVSSYTVEEGARILVRSLTPISTKSVAQGSRVYLEVAAPVAVGDTVIIPKGSQVTATVTSATRAGRAKGKAELNLLFDSIILPNGVVRAIQSRLTSADGRPVNRAEGTVRGGSDRVGDAAKVGTATAAGANVGSMAGNTGIGAAAGAAAGLAGIFASRGPDVILEPGATLEFALDRSLTYQSAEVPE